LVPELGPSFEEVEKERVQEEDGRKVETEDKGKQQALQRSWKNQGLDSRMSQGLWSEPVGPFIFLIRSCARKTTVPILVKHKLCKPQRSWTTEQGRKQKMVGKKDNATPTRRKKLQQEQEQESM
jgi:hypothetical protein